MQWGEVKMSGGIAAELKGQVLQLTVDRGIRGEGWL